MKHYEQLLEEKDCRKQWKILNECIEASTASPRTLDSIRVGNMVNEDSKLMTNEFSKFLPPLNRNNLHLFLAVTLTQIVLSFLLPSNSCFTYS